MAAACPTCGKDLLASDKTTERCPVCSELFHRRHFGHQFCSMECFRKSNA